MTQDQDCSDVYGELCGISNDLAGFLGDDSTTMTYVNTNTELERLRQTLNLKGPALSYGIIDSGVNPNHPQIKDLIEEMKSFTKEGPVDTLGHGTAVACCFISTAGCNVRLFSAKVTDHKNRVSLEAVLEALDWMVLCNVKAINMSLAFDPSEPNIDKLQDKINAIDKLPQPPGIFVAAGNRPDWHPLPANCGASCVAAFTTSDTIMGSGTCAVASAPKPIFVNRKGFVSSQAVLALERNDYILAFKNFQELLELEPYNIGVLWMSAIVAANLDERKKAITYLGRLKMIAPYYPLADMFFILLTDENSVLSNSLFKFLETN